MVDSSTSSTPTKKLMSTPNKDKIALRLIRVCGETHIFYFLPTESAEEIAKHVYENWPEDWSKDNISSHTFLKLIYQGRFLHGNVTLGALKLPIGKTTVMHLVTRGSLPEPQSQDQSDKQKSQESGCKLCCAIL